MSILVLLYDALDYRNLLPCDSYPTSEPLHILFLYPVLCPVSTVSFYRAGKLCSF